MKKLFTLFFFVLSVLPLKAELSFADTKRLAEQGRHEAQYNLGLYYYIGQGVAKDYALAVYWYRKSAEQGNANAQNNLGVCYSAGKGVAQDYTQAVYWYRKAAEQGIAIAQNNLGDCYYAGKGVERNAQQAVYWYKKAAEQGVADAQFNLGMCYSMGEGVAKDHTQAAYWYKKSAAQGNINASIALNAFGYNDTKKTTKENLTFTVNGVSFEMVYVEANGKINVNYSGKPMTFALSDYYIGKYEVTQELWKAIMGRSIRQQRDKQGSSWPLFGEGVHYPIYYVSWAECQVFINKLNEILSSELGGKKFALPNLGQWEYAARGGKKSANYAYPGSNNLNEVAWCKENSSQTSHTVGTKTPNELGIFDMFGNVEEYCQKIEGTWPCTFFGGSYERSNYTYGCSGCTTPDSRSAETGLRLVLIP